MKTIFWPVLICLSNLADPRLGDITASNSLVSTIDQGETFITIQGENIWVRDSPSTGQVVMKLNTGDQCKLLQKGRSQTIRGSLDFWYEIEFKGKKGWVFGSQTDLRLMNPAQQPIIGSLSFCEEVDALFSDLRAPAAFGYIFRRDKSFGFIVAAGYQIAGTYDWKSNIVTLFPKSLSVSDQKSILSGSISFYVHTRNQVVCLELKDKLTSGSYVPSSGCFCRTP